MSSGKKHRVALVGAGAIAATHLGFIKGVRNASVVALCDPLPNKARELAAAKDLETACYTDIDAMLREVEPSVVHVVTPPATHADIAIRAMEAGANVLVEKPMAMRVADCDRMIAAEHANGRRLCVDHNRLFDPVVRRALDLVDKGVVGDVVSVESHQGVNQVDLGGGATATSEWRIENPFAPFYNLAPHPFYLVSRLLGPVQEAHIMGRATHPGSALLTEIRALLEGESAYGFVVFSMGAQPYLNHLNVFGTKATLRVNLNTMTILTERVRNLPKLVAKLASNVEPAAQLLAGTAENAIGVATRRMKLYPGIGETIRRFYKSIENGDAPPVDGNAGRENVRLLNLVEDTLSAKPTLDRAGRANGHAEGERTWTS
ncbi:MAG: hypothetical protein RL698_443 [Pseudomonadota bacterium]|jgi:2-alkyl-3-oxoalkanoate reductase